MNLSFEIDTLKGAFDYLGDGFDYNALLTAVYSPCVILSRHEKMKKPENFIRGSERMLELSGKTREHLSRSMKKYYNTPTTYINELKLNYAINLMYSSNLSITDICFECGFSNISWFYKLFEREYGISPAKFKRNI